MAQYGGDFDVFAFITYPGASGIAMGGQACPGAPGGDKISFNRGYGPNDCDTYDPPEWIPCTVSNRIVLTAEVFNTYDMWLTYIFSVVNAKKNALFILAIDIIVGSA